MELKETGRPADGLVAARQAIAVDSNYWRSWVVGADVALAAGNLPEARRMISRAMQLEPRVRLSEVARQISQRAAATQR